MYKYVYIYTILTYQICISIHACKYLGGGQSYSPLFTQILCICMHIYIYINTVYQKINTSLHIHIWTCKKQRFLSMVMSSYRKSSVSTLYGPKNWGHPKLHPRKKMHAFPIGAPLDVGTDFDAHSCLMLSPSKPYSHFLKSPTKTFKEDGCLKNSTIHKPKNNMEPENSLLKK